MANSGQYLPHRPHFLLRNPEQFKRVLQGCELCRGIRLVCRGHEGVRGVDRGLVEVELAAETPVAPVKETGEERKRENESIAKERNKQT